MTFYNPLMTEIEKIPFIIYPCTGIEALLDRNVPGSIEQHVQKVSAGNPRTNRGEYGIVIVWNDGNDAMTDLWTFDQINTWGSGPLAYTDVFRNFTPDNTMGTSAEDGLIMLGREGEFRKLVMKRGTLADYTKGLRPKLPDVITNSEAYYTAQDTPAEQPQHTLIVDDAGDIRTLERRFLEFALPKSITYEANDPGEALDLLRFLPHIDLVITDGHMPVMNGFEMTKRIRTDSNYAAHAHTPVILISGGVETMSNAEFLRAVRDAGFAAYLPKPYTIDAFKSAVDTALGRTTNQ